MYFEYAFDHTNSFFLNIRNALKKLNSDTCRFGDHFFSQTVRLERISADGAFLSSKAAGGLLMFGHII